MERIQRFYEEVMGLDLIVDQGWAKIYPIGPTGYFGLVDDRAGRHAISPPESLVRLARLTKRDQPGGRRQGRSQRERCET